VFAGFRSARRSEPARAVQRSGVVELRRATAEDAAFLLEMLVEAYNWSGEQRVTRLDVESVPRLRHYVADWPRGQDFGLVALAENGAPVGAAWARTFSADDPGYGFVAEDIPEITMAVAAPRRGRGIGRRLLEALIAAARDKGWRAVSLSVEDGNRVVQLYRAVGFVTVGRVGNSNTMLLELRT
jgi:GNAT superfamily N-acetyltransferase